MYMLKSVVIAPRLVEHYFSIDVELIFCSECGVCFAAFDVCFAAFDVVCDLFNNGVWDVCLV